MCALIQTHMDGLLDLFLANFMGATDQALKVSCVRRQGTFSYADRQAV